LSGTPSPRSGPRLANGASQDGERRTQVAWPKPGTRIFVEPNLAGAAGKMQKT